MSTRLWSGASQWAGYFREPHAWLVLGMLVLGGALHYLDVIFPGLAGNLPAGLPRHSMERILFLLPVVYSGFVFGLGAGLLTLAVAVLLMVPQAIYVAEQPVSAIFETGAVVLVGGAVLLWFEGQRKEKQRRLEALGQLEVARQELSSHIEVIKKNQRQLSAMHEVCRVMAQSLELSDTLRHTIDKIVEVTEVDVAMVFLADDQPTGLALAAQRGLPQNPVMASPIIREAERLSGEAARSEGVVKTRPADGSPDQPPATGDLCQLIVPLASKGRFVGTLCVGVAGREFLAEEVGLLSAIGSQAGVAIENARLYREVQASERNYRGLFENVSVAMFIHSVGGKILAVNKAFAELTGYEPRELVGMSVANLRAPSTAGAVQEVEARLLKGEAIVQPYEMRVLRKDGSESIVSLSTRVKTEDGVPVAFEQVARDVTEQERMRSSLDFYLRQILTAQEEERTRIARELHDETAQELLVICQQLDRLATDASLGLSPEASSSLSALRATALGALTELRRLAQDLRPYILDTMGLVAAVEWLAEDLGNQSGIAARVKVVGQPRHLVPEKELLSFRIVQEALRNVRRHSRASMATVCLEFGDRSIRVSVEDDGMGFKMPERLGDLAGYGKLGLVGMYERARLLGGAVSVWSEPGRGTRVVAELPT